MLSAAGAALGWRERIGDTSRPAKPRILLIRPDHVGDVILTTPAVEVLRRGFPDAHMTMMVGPWSESVARRDSLLDEVAVCPFPGFTRAPKASPWEPYRLLHSVAAEISSRRYDAALILRFDHWWGAWMAAASGIPLRVGVRTPETEPFLNRSVALRADVHWVARSVLVAERLLEEWGGDSPPDHRRLPLRFEVSRDDEAAADELLADFGVEPGRPLIAIHPGTGAALKLWPADRWAELGRRLSAEGARVLVTGSASEAGLADRVAAGIPGSVSLAGKTDLGTLAALFGRTKLVVGVDSGPLHLAVAVDAPSVRLYGPTETSVYGPWGDEGRHRQIFAGLPGSPCGRLALSPGDGESPPCMRAIEVEQVEAVCRDLLSLSRGSSDRSQETTS